MAERSGAFSAAAAAAASAAAAVAAWPRARTASCSSFEERFKDFLDKKIIRFMKMPLNGTQLHTHKILVHSNKDSASSFSTSDLSNHSSFFFLFFFVVIVVQTNGTPVNCHYLDF